MSMDGIAAEAGVGKATIYLRYRSKADVATAALAHMRETGAPAPTGGFLACISAIGRCIRSGRLEPATPLNRASERVQDSMPTGDQRGNVRQMLRRCRPDRMA